MPAVVGVMSVLKALKGCFGCMNDSWIANTFYMTKSHYSEGHRELNKCCSFCLSSTIIMALVPPSSPSVPMLLQSSVMCVCVCVCVSRCERISDPLPSFVLFFKSPAVSPGASI